MKAFFRLFAAFGVCALAASCQKEVERIVVKEVDKVYGWSEVAQLTGTNKIVMGLGQGAGSLYLQLPGALGFLSPQPNTATRREFGYLGFALATMPTDINLRVPLGADFFARPYGPTTVALTATAPESQTSAATAFLSLTQLDPAATGIVENQFRSAPFGAINRNNYLLFGYRTAAGRSDPFVRLALVRATIQPGMRLQAETQLLRIPSPRLGTAADIRLITAIDDYFLVDCEDRGLYKIRQDGTTRRVCEPGFFDTFYKWKGTVYGYAINASNSLFFSSDDGETWQRYTGAPDVFAFNTYRIIGDSLVGIRQGNGANALYTLRWNGPNYTLRALKNDGLDGTSLNDIAQLGDTVYVGTTSGLFKRPLSKFFDTKK